MIYDAENTFLWGKSVAAASTTDQYSDIVKTGEGEAYNALWLMAHADQELSNEMTLELETSATEDFATPVSLGAFTLKKAKGSIVRSKVPVGNLGYLRLAYAAATGTISSGKLYAALVMDVDIQ